MKKSLLLFVVAAMLSAGGNAQSLKNLFNKVANKVTEGTGSSSDVVSGIASALLGSESTTSALSQDDIIGSWTYSGSACKLVTDDLLMSMAADAVQVKVEEVADVQMKKVGVVPGVTSVRFSEDGSCGIMVKGYEVAATYTVKNGGKVGLSFLMGQVNTTVDVVREGSTIKILCDADKLLEVIKKVIDKSGEKVDSEALSAINLLSTLVEGYDGLKLGMKLTK